MNARRLRSSAKTSSAKARTRGSAAAALSVYGACARIGPIPFSSAYAQKALTSALSIGLAAPPRGLRVKNWKTFAPMETAVWPMAR